LGTDVITDFGVLACLSANAVQLSDIEETAVQREILYREECTAGTLTLYNYNSLTTLSFI
jgi:hypothetical protein